MLTDEMKAEGWIEHDGLTPNKFKVRVRLRGGGEQVDTMANFIWTHFDIPSDIIAYRPEPTP
jgi:hypothetical protein